MASLEEALAANTKALEANTAALNGIKGAAAAKTAETGTKSTGAKGGTKAASTKVTEEELRKTATAFLGVQDATEREARKAWVGKMNEHFGVAKISEAPQDKWADIVRMFKQLSAGETPPELASDEDEGGSGDDMI